MDTKQKGKIFLVILAAVALGVAAYLTPNARDFDKVMSDIGAQVPLKTINFEKSAAADDPRLWVGRHVTIKLPTPPFPEPTPALAKDAKGGRPDPIPNPFPEPTPILLASPAERPHGPVRPNPTPIQIAATGHVKGE